MTFECPHTKKCRKGEGLLSDLFNTSVKIIKNNKENLSLIIDESTNLKDNVTKNIDVVKKINKLNETKTPAPSPAPTSTSTPAPSPAPTPTSTPAPSSTNKKEINNIISKKKSRGFYDTHT